MLKLRAALVWVILSQVTVFAGEISHSQFLIGQTQQGRDIVVERFGTGEERILLVGCIHGTEDIGVRLLNHTMFNVRANPEWLDGKTVYMLSLLNADGLVMNIRGNRDNIDINRQFPSKNFGRGWFNGDEPLQSVEAQVLMDFILATRPERILVIHQPLDGIDYDGSARELAEYLSEQSNIRIHRLGSRSGSMGTFFGKELGGAVLTLEIPNEYNAVDSTDLWERYGVFMRNFILYTKDDEQSN